MIRFPLFGNSDAADANQPATPATDSKAAAKPAASHPLDEATGGIFSAATSGERASRVRAWLATEPDAAAMQEVYKELSTRDKGAARPLREKLDEIKRSKGQEQLAAEWAAKAQTLLQAEKLHIADAMAWQRDAAKAGAPLSKEPLSNLKNQLAERIKTIEDLQTRVQIQREAAVLLAQRIELLSTKSWQDADDAASGLQTDVAHWHSQAQSLQQDPSLGNIEPKYAAQLEAATNQLQLVAQAFADALEQTRLAASDSSQPLPPVPVWADEIRAQRGPEQAASAAASAASAASASSQDPAQTSDKQAEKTAAQTARKLQAQQAIAPVVQALEQELANGYSKTSMAAAHALRNAMKTHARFLDAAIEAQAHAALAKAGELEGWQRWRADQIRQELVQKAEALIHRATPPEALPEIDEHNTNNTQAPADASAAAADTPSTNTPAASTADSTAASASSPANTEPAAASPLPSSPHSPRKLQEALRHLREQWKQTDQGGVPNHALWKRFDQACNEAYRIVEHWLGEMKQNAAAQRTIRTALLDELKAWGEQLATQSSQGTADWKAAHRDLFQFTRRWREAGHLSEKAFAELQPQWKAALQQASAPLQAVQTASIALRQQMTEEAANLCAAASLRIDAIKQLQQRWQQEAQQIPLDRRQEQKLWDAFRKPIDEAFQRKGQQREQASAALSQRDQAVLNAAKALDAASASGDAQAIRQAMQALEAALHAQQQDQAPAAQPAASAPEAAPQTPTEPSSEPASASSADHDVAADAATGTEPSTEPNVEPSAESSAEPSIEPHATSSTETAPANASAPATEPATQAAPQNSDTPARAPAAPKPLIAMRGDDRPSAKQPAAAASGKHTQPTGRDAARTAGRDNRRSSSERPANPRFADRASAPRAPRLSDAAFRAQRDALDNAQAALRKLAAQAHGQTVTQLLDAWQQRQPEAIPAANELGKAINNQQRSQWQAALGSAASSSAEQAAQALLRIEIAAEVPTPAEHINARRALQLQLLTRRNDPAPAQTWTQDLSSVLAAPFEDTQAKRLQAALRVLLKQRNSN